MKILSKKKSVKKKNPNRANKENARRSEQITKIYCRETFYHFLSIKRSQKWSENEAKQERKTK